MRLFRKHPPQPGPTRTEALARVPLKNNAVQELSVDDNQTTLSYPVVTRAWLAAIARRFSQPAQEPARRKIQLDAMGTTVWGLIDGKRSVQQVIGAFTEAYQVHPREAEVAVTRFLRMLGQRGIIGLR